MTSNHDPGYRHERPAGALLAGVCTDLAGRLGWNVWALRILFVLGLLIQTIATGVVYVLLAVLLPRFGGRTADVARPGPDLKSGELAERKARIADLERRFRKMERGDGG